MADYGQKGFVMGLPYWIGMLVAAGILSIFNLKGGFAIFILITVTIVVGKIFKAVFRWK